MSGERVEPVRVVAARFEDLLGVGLRKVIDADRRLALVGDEIEPDGLESVVADVAPDVAVLNFATLRGVYDVYRLNKEHPETALVVLVDQIRREELVQLLRFGARCCLPWHARRGEIVDALVYAAQGVAVVGQDQRLLAGRQAAKFEVLSARELEVFQLICRRQTNVEIARALHLSPETIKDHVSRVLRKLQATNRVELIAYAYRNAAPAGGGGTDRHACTALELPHSKQRSLPSMRRHRVLSRIAAPARFTAALTRAA